MHVEILVEELSAEVALRQLVPKIAGTQCTFDVHPFQGKRDLMSKLPHRLRGYKHWAANDEMRIVVLVDRDRDDCRDLKSRLDKVASEVGLSTKTLAGEGQPFVVLNRVAIEELEAWFLGDCEAIRAAYPRVPQSLERRRRFRDPDAVLGGTWEQLESVLQKAGHHMGGLAKTVAAEEIAARMDPSRNRSRSFQEFRAGLLSAISI